MTVTDKNARDQIFDCAAISFGHPSGGYDLSTVVSLEEVFAVNSMKLIDFVDRIEQSFGVELPASQLTSENVLGVPNLLALIDSALGLQ